MDFKNRGVWLLVAAIAILACCVLLACLAAGVALLARPALDCCSDQPLAGRTGDVLQPARITRSYEVGPAPTLWVDSFAGSVTVRGEDVETIQVVATRKVRRQSDLDRIQVTMTERDGGLAISARNPARVSNASVELELTVPAATHLEANLAAGAVVVRGLTGGAEVDSAAGAIVLEEVRGGIEARTAAGSVVARRTAGPVRLESAAGVIEYQGIPEGDCRFSTAVGSISLELPPDPDVAVDLRAEVGAVDAACDLEGQAARRRLQGVIGSGAQGTITARTALGDIDLVCR